MGIYDDEDEDYSVQLINKDGSQATNVMNDEQKRQAAQTKGALGQSYADKRVAKQGWEEALRNNVGQPIQNAAQGLGRAIEGLIRPQETQKPILPSATGGSQVQQDLYDRIMEERLRMLEQGLDPNSPDSMSRFQKIREMMLKKGG